MYALQCPPGEPILMASTLFNLENVKNLNKHKSFGLCRNETAKQNSSCSAVQSHGSEC